jgi:hypothetical protein
VTLRNSAGRVTLATDEARAARAVSRALRLGRARSRIGRVYVYQWRAAATDRFDSGLVRPDGTARPSLTALATALRAVPAVTVRRSATRLVVRVRCRASDGRCRGRVTLALRTRSRAGGAWRTASLPTRAYATTAEKPTATLTVRTPAALRRRARAAAQSTVRATAQPAV